MGIRVECDWCRQPIRAGTPYVTIEINGKVGREDVGGPARVYCGDDDGSCARRLLALLDANPGGPVDMGMEWQLVTVEREEAEQQASVEPTSGRGGGRSGSTTPTPQPVAPDATFYVFLTTLAPSPRSRLRRALCEEGIDTLDQLESVSDADLLALEGVGQKTVSSLRAFIAARRTARATGSPAAIPELNTFESLQFSEHLQIALRDQGVLSVHDLRLKLRSLTLDAAMLAEIEAAA